MSAKGAIIHGRFEVISHLSEIEQDDDALETFKLVRRPQRQDGHCRLRLPPEAHLDTNKNTAVFHETPHAGVEPLLTTVVKQRSRDANLATHVPSTSSHVVVCVLVGSCRR